MRPGRQKCQVWNEFPKSPLVLTEHLFSKLPGSVMVTVCHRYSHSRTRKAPSFCLWVTGNLELIFGQDKRRTNCVSVIRNLMLKFKFPWRHLVQAYVHCLEMFILMFKTSFNLLHILGLLTQVGGYERYHSKLLAGIPWKIRMHCSYLGPQSGNQVYFMWLRKDPEGWSPLVIACTFCLLLYYILYFKQRLCEYTLSICAIFNDQILCNQCKQGRKGHRTQNYFCNHFYLIQSLVYKYWHQKILLRKGWYYLETIFTSLFFLLFAMWQLCNNL